METYDRTTKLTSIILALIILSVVFFAADMLLAPSSSTAAIVLGHRYVPPSTTYMYTGKQMMPQYNPEHYYVRVQTNFDHHSYEAETYVERYRSLKDGDPCTIQLSKGRFTGVYYVSSID